MSFITSLLGIKVPAWVYELIAGALIALFLVVYLEHRGAEKILGELQKSSADLLDKANKKIGQQIMDHNTFVTENRSKTDALLATNKSLNDQLDDRVRAFNTYRSQHPNVPRPPSGSGPAPSGECGVISCGDLASRALQDGGELTRSNGELAANLQSCQRERDSLNGLPK